MVNTDDFIKRLEIILEYYGLSASVFADKMGVQRSGLSHLMSGRNKPSLDFVMKIIENFPDVDFYWLLNGVGSFPKSGSQNIIEETISPTLFPSEEIPSLDLFSNEQTTPVKEPVLEHNLFSQDNNIENKQTSNNPVPEINSVIDRIVIFYTNGTFKEYVSGN